MKLLIAGADGYLGQALMLKRLAMDDDVVGVDNFSRRKNVKEVGSHSAIPIASSRKRLRAMKRHYGRKPKLYEGDLRDYEFIERVLKKEKPDAIVHFAEQPSAPYSMIDVAHAVYTHDNNVNGTLNLLYAMKRYCPDAHLLKLGTMGEYGTPNIQIPEGEFTITYKGRKDTLPFPRQPGSFYHLTKVHDTNNIMFACKIWGLRSTDIMQGVVYGTKTDEMLEKIEHRTRFDFDEVFGTAINRFCAQVVIGHPLTVYGAGGQTRGYIALRDSMQCLSLALDNPPSEGEYRTFNQYDECYSINQLAGKVQDAAWKLDIAGEHRKIDNPRVESEEHYYKPVCQRLKKLGFKPTMKIEDELRVLLKDLLPHRERIRAKRDKILPTVRWRD